jgi:hypothetical protein
MFCFPSSRKAFAGIVTVSTIFLKKEVCRTQNDPKFGRRGVVLVIPMPGIKGSGLCLSEKELLERRSGTFCHKTTPGNINYTTAVSGKCTSHFSLNLPAGRDASYSELSRPVVVSRKHTFHRMFMASMHPNLKVYFSLLLFLSLQIYLS